MPRTKEQLEEIRKEKRALIKQAAMELFAIDGYHPTSISKIAKKANISKGLLYNYFENKEALMQEIVADGLNETYESFDQNNDGVLTADEFEYFVRQSIQLLKRRKHFYRLFYTIIMQPDVQDFIEHGSTQISHKVMDATVKYFADRFTDPQAEMLVFTSLIKGLSMQYVFSDDPFFTDDIIEKAITKIIEMYKK